MDETYTFVAKDGREVTLRPAVPADAAEIINTVRSTSLERSYVLMEEYGRNAASEEAYIRDMDRQHNLLLVAVADGAVIGSLAALQADGGGRPQTAHVLNIGLHIAKEYRGHGIGTEMLKYTAAWARERGFTKLEAAIFTTNKRSLNLFRKAGFVEDGTRQKQIRVGKNYIDEVYMGMFLE
ncbi:MAG: GNAT family N-acetyltransferase [Nitrospirota bacterium]